VEIQRMSPTANPRHRPERSSQERENFRGSASSRGYDRHHQAWRLLVLNQQPLCVGWPRGLHPRGLPKPAFVADHVVPLRTWAADPALARRQLAALLASEGRPLALTEETGAWSLENGAGLCFQCHARKSRSER
jgi:hypothetical protein